MNFDLDANDRLMILAAAIGAVIATGLLVICKICPCCYLRKHCPLSAKYSEDSESDDEVQFEKYQIAKAMNGPDHPLSYSKTPKSNLLEKGGYVGSETDRSSFRSIRGKHFTSISRDSYGSNLSLSSNSTGGGHSPQHKTTFSFLSEPAPTPKPELEYGLQHDSTDERLAIYVKNAKNLPRNLHGSPSDCFLRIVLVRDLKKGWVRKRPSGISLEDVTAPGAQFDTAEFKTQTVRRNVNPVFNEYFEVELKEKDRKYAILKFAVCTADKIGRFNVAAECHLSLGKVDLTKMQNFIKTLKDYRPQIGELLISLNYLPTAERICLTIIKAAHLKIPTDLSGLPNVFVKAALVYRGKVLEKRKTSVHTSSTNPEFQESIIFDLPFSELDKTTLVLTVAHQELSGGENNREKESGHETSSSGGAVSDDSKLASSKSAGGLKSRRRSAGNLLDVSRINGASALPHKSKSTDSVRAKTCILGRLALGCHSTGIERLHWIEMIRTPRTVTTRWHNLIP